MKSKFLFVVGLLLIATMILTACGPKDYGPVTLTFWEQEGDDVDVFIDQLIADFQVANPNIT
ncbi:MAG: hypothetical protein ABIJ65_05640, partial [Chloroflexota bacterium]